MSKPVSRVRVLCHCGRGVGIMERRGSLRASRFAGDWRPGSAMLDRIEAHADDIVVTCDKGHRTPINLASLADVCDEARGTHVPLTLGVQRFGLPTTTGGPPRTSEEW